MARSAVALQVFVRASVSCCALALFVVLLAAQPSFAQLPARDANPLRRNTVKTAVAESDAEPEPLPTRSKEPEIRLAAAEEPAITYKSDDWLNEGPGETYTYDLPEGDWLDEEYDGERPGLLFRAKHWLFRPRFGLAMGRPFTHGEPDDPDRYVGLGRPLVGTSWLNRPLSAGVFGGALFGDDPFNGRVQQGGGFLGGVRLGYDFDHYTGFESRLGLSRLELYDNLNQPLGVTSGIGLFDVNLLYYPWGDALWRPYLSAGVGFASFSLFDEQQQLFNDALLLTPLGLGVKYYFSPGSACRIEVYDNLAWGRNGIATMHNFSVSAGWELRYGARPRLYYPAHPGIVRW